MLTLYDTKYQPLKSQFATSDVFNHLQQSTRPCGRLPQTRLAGNHRYCTRVCNNLVYTTSHLGIDLKTGELVNNSIEAELEAIFDCLDAALKHAGVAAGLFQAFKLVSYLVDPAHEQVMQDIFKRRFPGHTPTWTLVIVKEINVPGMRAELSAEAALFHT